MAKKSKTILILTIVLTAGAAVAVPIAVKHYNSKLNFAKMSPQQVRQYFDSNQFRDANEDTRREIRGQMFEAMQARMEKEASDYCALPEGDQRTAYLDNIIDEMQARRAEFLANRDPNRPFDPNRFDPNRPRDPNRFARFGQRGANGGQRPRINPQQMRERSGRMSAQSRVQMMQFQRAMRERMDQRGIQGPMGRGGFGGPGGFGGGGPGFGGPPN
jgi:hypothetical protein